MLLRILIIILVRAFKTAFMKFHSLLLNQNPTQFEKEKHTFPPPVLLIPQNKYFQLSKIDMEQNRCLMKGKDLHQLLH